MLTVIKPVNCKIKDQAGKQEDENVHTASGLNNLF